MGKKFKTRKKYRLTFVNENTFNAVWSVKLTRAKVWALSALCCAAIAALVVAILAWSPLNSLLPGHIKPAERTQIVDYTTRFDSLQNRSRIQQQYLNNLMSILSGDSIELETAAIATPAEITDTLMTATETEREFVNNWMARERGHLSVLTPIVAEGMMFRLPANAAVLLDDGSGFRAPNGATVWAIQEGTVISTSIDPLTSLTTVIVQHTNDFISTYGGLRLGYISIGQHVAAGQAIGVLSAEGLLPMSVWHQGRRAELHTLLPLNTNP